MKTTGIRIVAIVLAAALTAGVVWMAVASAGWLWMEDLDCRKPCTQEQDDDELLESIAQGKIDGCTAFRTLAQLIQKEE